MNLETIMLILLSLIIVATVAYFAFNGKNNQNDLAYNEQNTELLNIEEDEIKRLQAQLSEIQEEKAKLESKFNNQNSQASPNSIVENQFLNDNIELKAKIDKLEEEIDDLEDEIKDSKTKVKKYRTEKDELLVEVDIVKKIKEILIQENDNLVKINSEQEKQIKEDKNSLKFIDDILNANNSNNDDYKKIYDETLGIVKHIKNEIKNCLNDFDKNNQYPSEEDCDHWRKLELKSWIKGKKVIAIVGEFSAGKTSIVNRILSQDDPNAILLPVNSKETTAIPTYISKGIDFNCQFYSPSEELKNIRKETFETLTKSVLDKINISSLIKYFVVSYDNKYLENISILDTPGFGSNSDEIIARTADVIKEADALFWVIDANAGEMNQSSIDVIRNHLDSIPLYLIINKSDSKSEDDLDKLQKKIQETIEQNQIETNGIIQFSNKKDIKGLMELIDQVKDREHPQIIKVVLEKIESLIKDKSSNLKIELDNQRMYKNNEDIIKSKLKRIEKDVKYCAENIERLVNFETSFWSKDYYKIAQNDYSEFEKNLNSISTLSNNITKESENHSDIIKNLSDVDSNINSIKYQLKNLQSAKENFIKSVKDYNPNLLN